MGIKLQQGGSTGSHSTGCLRYFWENDQFLAGGTSLVQAHTVVGGPCQQLNPHQSPTAAQLGQRKNPKVGKNQERFKCKVKDSLITDGKNPQQKQSLTTSSQQTNAQPDSEQQLLWRNSLPVYCKM